MGSDLRWKKGLRNPWMGPAPAASTRTAGLGVCVARGECLPDSWCRAPGLSVVLSLVETSTLQKFPQAWLCPQPITHTGRVGVPQGWLPCWGMLPHGAKLCSGPHFFSPVQRSWEFIPARHWYASSQKLLFFFPLQVA